MFWLGKRREYASSLEFMILLVLADQRPRAASDVILALNKTFAGLWEATPNTIHSKLSRMKKSKPVLLQSESIKTPAGPRVEVYQPTTRGYNLLADVIQANTPAEIRFMKRYIKMAGEVATTASFRDVILSFLDLFHSREFAETRDYNDPEAREILLKRLFALLNQYREQVGQSISPGKPPASESNFVSETPDPS